MATVVARYLLDEASTGTGPTTCADDTGNGNTLTIDYSSGDLEWTNVAAGNGLDFLASPATTNSAVCELDDIATNGTVGSSLDGATQVWMALAMANIAGDGTGSRLLAVGTDSGNTDVSIIKESTDVWRVRWDQESGGDNFGSDAVFHTSSTSPEVLVVQIDTTQASASDALQIWWDDTEDTGVTFSSGSYVQNSTLGSVNSTNRKLTLGNRGSQNRNVQGQIYAAMLGTGVLTSQEVTDISTNWLSDNDANPLSAGGGASGSAAQTLPLTEQSVSAKEVYSGTGAQTMPSAQTSAEAQSLYAATAAQSLPSLGQDAAGAQIFSAVSAQTLPAQQQAAAGELGYAGNAAQTMAALTQNMSGFTDVTAVGASTLPRVTQNAVGTGGMVTPDGFFVATGRRRRR